MKDKWEKVRLGDVCEFHYGRALQSHKRIKGDIPVFSSAGIIDYHDKVLVNSAGIIVGRKGSIGTVYFSSHPFYCIDTTYYILADEKYDLKYFYFLLKSLNLEKFNEDSAVPGLNRNTAYLQEFFLPPLPTQRAIAATLSCLDDKIALNRRINANLEAQAQAIFKSWFVDFEPWGGKKPTNWTFGKAEDFFEISIGKTPPRKESQWFTTNSQDIVWVSISDMGNCGMFISDSSEYLTAESVTRFNIKIIPSGTVLLSFKLTVGRVTITNGKMTTNEAIAHFKSSDNTTMEYLYCYLKTFDYQVLGNTSSIATAVNSKTIKAMPFFMPNDKVLQEFHTTTALLFEQIRSHLEESTRLAAIRDALLPRLMSGELSATDISGNK